MWTGNWQQERKPSLARQHLMATLTVLFWRLIIICSIPGFPSPSSHLFPSPVSHRCLWDVTCKLDQTRFLPFWFHIPSSEEPERGQNIIGGNFPVHHWSCEVQSKYLTTTAVRSLHVLTRFSLTGQKKATPNNPFLPNINYVLIHKPSSLWWWLFSTRTSYRDVDVTL